jgi:hypothetical protein
MTNTDANTILNAIDGHVLYRDSLIAEIDQYFRRAGMSLIMVAKQRTDLYERGTGVLVSLLTHALGKKLVYLEKNSKTFRETLERNSTKVRTDSGISMDSFSYQQFNEIVDFVGEMLEDNLSHEQMADEMSDAFDWDRDYAYDVVEFIADYINDDAPEEAEEDEAPDDRVPEVELVQPTLEQNRVTAQELIKSHWLEGSDFRTCVEHIMDIHGWRQAFAERLVRTTVEELERRSDDPPVAAMHEDDQAEERGPDLQAITQEQEDDDPSKYLTYTSREGRMSLKQVNLGPGATTGGVTAYELTCLDCGGGQIMIDRYNPPSSCASYSCQRRFSWPSTFVAHAERPNGSQGMFAILVGGQVSDARITGESNEGTDEELPF